MQCLALFEVRYKKNISKCCLLQFNFSRLKINTVSILKFLTLHSIFFKLNFARHLFVCVEVLWPSQPNGVMSSAVSLPNYTFTGQA